VLIESIAAKTGLDITYLKRISKTSNHRYRIFRIKKRRPKNENDFRWISQPSKHVKYLQKILINFIFKKLPIHDSVYSYRVGVNITDHAKIHLNNRYLLRVDFENFFPSIKRSDIEELLRKNLLQLSAEDRAFVCDAVCFNGCLTIGAPSSPIISNSVLYSLDDYWFNFSKKKGITYSRYADDIYFSTNIPNVLSEHYEEFQKYIQNSVSPRLKINMNKSVFTSKKRKRVVTGIVLTSNGSVSIGREKKRGIKSSIYKYINNKLSKEEVASLIGHLNFANSVEPAFISSLRGKYGDKVISELGNF
jgi:RNA-directed DNA polymerase